MRALLRRPFAFLARLHVRDPVGFRVMALLGVVALMCAVRLLGADPWNDGIAERLREGKSLRPVDFARTWGWWAALVDLLVVAAAMALRRHWLDREPPPEVPALRAASSGAGGRRGARAFGVCVLGAMLALAWLGAPRLSHSFWDDEEYSLIHAVHGSYVRLPSGEIEFNRARLRDTLWHFHKPSNHVPQSLLSRWSNQLWRGLADPEARFASEVATRAPVFVAGLLAVAAPALLLRRLGFAMAGACVAWLLALHPWHLRYATEARGYALLLLFVPTTLLLLSRALEVGSARRWAAYGAAQLVLVWAFPAAVFTLVVTNLVALAWIPWTQPTRAGRRSQLQGLLLANLFGGVAGLFLMLPNLMQLRVFLEREDLAGFDAGKFLPDVLSHLWIGTPFRVSLEPERFVDALDLAANAPLAYPLLLAASVAAFVLGVVRLLAGGRRTLPLALALLLPAPLTFGYALARETFLNQWYLVFALPGVAIFAAAGLTWPGAALRSRAPRAGAALALALPVAFVATFGVVTHDMRAALRALPLQPIRDSVALTRAVADPFDPANRRVVTVSFQAPPLYYDPLVQVVSHPDALRRLMRQADAEGQRLYVNYGRPRLARRRYGPLLELLENERLFALEAELVGSSPRGVRRVYRYLGRPGR